MQQRSTSSASQRSNATVQIASVDSSNSETDDSSKKTHPHNTGSSNNNTGLLRIVLIVLVLAGFLVMYSIVRESPGTDLPNYKDAVRKRKEMDKRNKMIKKNIDKLKQALKDGSEDDDNNNNHGEAATFTEKPKNVPGA